MLARLFLALSLLVLAMPAAVPAKPSPGATYVIRNGLLYEYLPGGVLDVYEWSPILMQWELLFVTSY